MNKLESVKSVICAQPDSSFPFFAWPSVERLPDGSLAGACSGFRLRHVCPFGKAVIFYSRDEGQTWTAPAPVIDTPLDDRDAGVVAFGSGRVFFSSFNLPIAYYRRRNKEYGLEKQHNLMSAYLDYIDGTDAEDKYYGSTYRISEDGGYTFGPILRAPVSTPHGPMRMRDGSLLYVGRTMTSMNDDPDMSTPLLEAWFLNEKDEWEKRGDIENIRDEAGWLLSAEPHAVQLPDGKIVVHIRVQRKAAPRRYTTYQCESTDGGFTFTRPHQILTDLGGAPDHLLVHSCGRLMAVYGYREAPYGIRVVFSDDGGITWSEPYVLEDECRTGDIGYPATIELKDGSLLTVYYESLYEEGQPESSVIVQRIWKLPE